MKNAGMAAVRGIVLAAFLLALAPAGALAAGGVTIASPSGGTFCSVPTFSGEANGTGNEVTLSIQGPANESPSTAPSGTSWSITPGALPSGTYTAVATQPNEPLETPPFAESNHVTFTIAGPPITQHLADATVPAGGTATFTAGASGADAVQWEVLNKGESSWSGTGVTTETLTVPNASVAQDGNKYRAVFSNSCGSTKTNEATLHVTATAPVLKESPPAAVSAPNGGSVTLKAVATGNPAPTASWGVKPPGGSWTGAPGANTVTTGETTETTLVVKVTTGNSGSAYGVEFNNGGGRVTTETKVTVERSAPVVTKSPNSEPVALGKPVTLSATASGIPEPTVQWEESHNEGASWSKISGATSDSFTIPPQKQERIVWYRACFSNEVQKEVCSSPGVLTFTSPAAPSVVVNPLSTTVSAGGSATFTAAAIGPPAPTVQWEESGNGGASWTPVSGATGNVLTITGATPARSGHLFRALFVNERGSATSAAATLTVTTPPPPPPPPPPTSLVVGFSWFPPTPHVGEAVTLASSSSDAASPIVGLAWDFAGSGPFLSGGPLATTSFATAGSHLVRLRATAANGLVRELGQTIFVLPRQLNLMSPFPIVRMAGSLTSSGVRVTLLTVQAPVGSAVSARCVGRRCPYKLERAYVLHRAGTSRVLPVTLWRFERFLRAGVRLQIKVYKSGQVGKYTTFTIRRGHLPVRVDECLDPSVFTPMVCPG